MRVNLLYRFRLHQLLLLLKKLLLQLLLLHLVLVHVHLRVLHDSVVPLDALVLRPRQAHVLAVIPPIHTPRHIQVVVLDNPTDDVTC